jgi:hypothetical protein
MLANLIVAHVESNRKTCFGRPFDSAQDKLTTGGFDKLTTGGFDKRVVFSFEASLLLSLRAPQGRSNLSDEPR